MDQATARAFDRDTQGQPVTKTATATSDKKDRRDNPIYASRELDEYGLTPNELRVYFRIARRAGEEGKCWESIPNMARTIGLGESTVRRCCQILALARLTSEHQIEGWTTERRINPISRWKNKAELPGIRNIVLRSEEKRTPVTRSRGVTRITPVTADGAPLSRQTGAPLSRQQGLPLSPETVKGIPSEGIPIEVNPKKEIPHTKTPEDKSIEAIPVEPIVCVSTPDGFLELDQEEEYETDGNPWDAEPFDYYQVETYVLWCKHRLGENITNPVGLVKTILKERDPILYFNIENILMDVKADLQERARRRELEEEQRQALEQHNRRLELQRIEREHEQREEERRKAEEWERNAPQREQERLEKEENDRRAAVEDCKRYWVQWAHKPQLRDGFISSTLPQDEQSKAEFENWKAEQQTQTTATAGA